MGRKNGKRNLKLLQHPVVPNQYLQQQQLLLQQQLHNHYELQHKLMYQLKDKYDMQNLINRQPKKLVHPTERKKLKEQNIEERGVR